MASVRSSLLVSFKSRFTNGVSSCLKIGFLEPWSVSRNQINSRSENGCCQNSLTFYLLFLRGMRVRPPSLLVLLETHTVRSSLSLCDLPRALYCLPLSSGSGSAWECSGICILLCYEPCGGKGTRSFPEKIMVTMFLWYGKRQ